MCGIAGVINKKKTVNVGEQMGLMLQGLKHRGPDSTGYAMYGTPLKKGFVMRFKISENEAEKVNANVDSPVDLKNRKNAVDAILKKHGAKVTKQSSSTPYACRYIFDSRKGATCPTCQWIHGVGSICICRQASMARLIFILWVRTDSPAVRNRVRTSATGERTTTPKLQWVEGTHQCVNIRRALASSRCSPWFLSWSF